MTDLIFLTAVFLLEFTLFFFMPTLNGEKTLFGIRLKNDDFQIYGAPILRTFRRDLSLAAIASLSAVWLTHLYLPNSLPVAYIFATLVILLPLFKCLRQTWRVQDEAVVTRIAAPLAPRSLKDFTNYFWELIVVVLTVASFVILAIYYPRLPDVVPIHWNAAGVADGWAKKSLSSVFFVPVLAAFLQIFWVVLKQDIVGARFRVPADERADCVFALKESSLRANVGMIDWCRLFVGLLMGIVSLLVLSAASQISFLADALNILIWANLVLLLSGAAFYLYRIIAASRAVKSLTGQTTFRTADETAAWSDGGLYYYNPQDAAFMVEKPGGVGYTINFAHKKRVFVYLALILSPIVFVLADLALTNN